MTTAKTTPTDNYAEAGAEQAKGKAKMDKGETVEGKQLKAEGVADAQQEPNIAMNDVTDISE